MVYILVKFVISIMSNFGLGESFGEDDSSYDGHSCDIIDITNLANFNNKHNFIKNKIIGNTFIKNIVPKNLLLTYHYG